MGCLKLSYYEQERALEVNPIFFTSAVEKKRYAEKNRLSSSTFGFQGQEVDNEINNRRNHLNYTYRMHNSDLGRFLSVDPLAKSFPWNSSFAFSENIVISGIDLEGLEYLDSKANIDYGVTEGNLNSNDIYKITKSSNTLFYKEVGYDLNSLEFRKAPSGGKVEVFRVGYNGTRTLLGAGIVGHESIDAFKAGEKIPNSHLENLALEYNTNPFSPVGYTISESTGGSSANFTTAIGTLTPVGPDKEGVNQVAGRVSTDKATDTQKNTVSSIVSFQQRVDFVREATKEQIDSAKNAPLNEQDKFDNVIESSSGELQGSPK